MRTYHLATKPLSVNRAWQGRRFKSPEYKAYCREIAALMQAHGVVKVSGRVRVHYVFELVNFALTDADNLVKPLQDIIVQCGAIDDDRYIEEYIIEKKRAAKDAITVIIESLENGRMA